MKAEDARFAIETLVHACAAYEQALVDLHHEASLVAWRISHEDSAGLDRALAAAHSALRDYSDATVKKKS